MIIQPSLERAIHPEVGIMTCRDTWGGSAAVLEPSQAGQEEGENEVEEGDADHGGGTKGGWGWIYWLT